jgi:hypothetical protein
MATPPVDRSALPGADSLLPQGRPAPARPESPPRSLGRDVGLGLLLCILLVLLILFASGPSGETQGFIYVDF